MLLLTTPLFCPGRTLSQPNNNNENQSSMLESCDPPNTLYRSRHLATLHSDWLEKLDHPELSCLCYYTDKLPNPASGVDPSGPAESSVGPGPNDVAWLWRCRADLWAFLFLHFPCYYPSIQFGKDQPPRASKVKTFCTIRRIADF